MILYIYDVMIDEHDLSICLYLLHNVLVCLTSSNNTHYKPMVGDGQFDYQRGDCLDLDIGKKSCLPY